MPADPIEDRVAAIEQRLDRLRVPPVRDELLALRDAYGLRLSAIEARLGQIERDLSENESWIARRLGDVDDRLAEILGRLS